MSVAELVRNVRPLDQMEVVSGEHQGEWKYYEKDFPLRFISFR